jgi:hypothetical protein
MVAGGHGPAQSELIDNFLAPAVAASRHALVE